MGYNSRTSQKQEEKEMSDFSSGVKSFITGECTIKVHFPVDWKDRADVCCMQCPYLSSNERMCQLNKQPVQYPKQYIGYDCPLKFNENEEKQNETN